MPRNDERPVSSVLHDIVGNVQEIVRSEVRLARAEIKDEMVEALKGVKPLMGGAVMALYAIGLLLLAIVYGLSLLMQPWLAALSVGIVLAVIAAVLIHTGRDRLKGAIRKPQKTVESVRENVQWLKDQTR